MPHEKPNFGRMMQLIDEVFATRSDPDQLQVNRQQLEKLYQIDPSTLMEVSNDEGPLIWVLMIPTTKEVMQLFLSGHLSERELLDKTQIGENYSCIYLCSATTLPEIRSQGKTKAL